MKKRKNEELIPYLLNEKDLKIFFSIESKLSQYLKILNHLFFSQNIKYSFAIIKASEKSIKETRKNIRLTDVFIKVPYLNNFYVIILQNTDSKAAIDFTNRLINLISRNFMIHKKRIKHQTSLICIENEPIDATSLTYEIMLSIKHLKESEDNSWNEIKRF